MSLFRALRGLTAPAMTSPHSSLVRGFAKKSGDNRPSWEITRTKTGALPVYVEYHANGQCITRIRRVTGDVNALAAAVRAQVGDKVRISVYAQSVSVASNRSNVLKEFLQGFGF